MVFSRLASVVFGKASAAEAGLSGERGIHKSQLGTETAPVLEEVQPNEMTFTLISTFEMIFQREKIPNWLEKWENTQI